VKIDLSVRNADLTDVSITWIDPIAGGFFRYVLVPKGGLGGSKAIAQQVINVQLKPTLQGHPLHRSRHLIPSTWLKSAPQLSRTDTFRGTQH
jgi:hypothetical protein